MKRPYLVLDAVDLAILGVGGTDEEVVGDVVQVSTVLEPGPSHADVVGGALALCLDQDGGILQHVTNSIKSQDVSGQPRTDMLAAAVSLQTSL